jgi:hypothetical protein
MATVPVLDPIESRSIGQDAATLQFQRLERVRARLGARRRYRFIIATKLVIVLASVGVLGFTATRRMSFERLGSPGAPAPVATLKPSAASPATDSAFGPPAATDSVFGPPAAIVPPPRRVDRVKRDATHPPRLRANAKRRGRPLSDGQGGGAAAPSRQQEDVEAIDPTTAIDWLLKTSPTRATSASLALLPGREDIPR